MYSMKDIGVRNWKKEKKARTKVAAINNSAGL